MVMQGKLKGIGHELV